MVSWENVSGLGIGNTNVNIRNNNLENKSSKEECLMSGNCWMSMSHTTQYD